MPFRKIILDMSGAFHVQDIGVPVPILLDFIHSFSLSLRFMPAYLFISFALTGIFLEIHAFQNRILSVS